MLDYETISTRILPLPLLQEGQLILFKYTENFTTKKWKSSKKKKKKKKSDIVHISAQNIGCEYFTRLDEAVLTRTHNLCFEQKFEKNDVYPCKPKSYYIKVGFKRVKII